MRSEVHNLKELQNQSRKLKTVVVSANLVRVESGTDADITYDVHVAWRANDRIDTRCDCPWSHYGGSICKHRMAALNALAAHKGKRLSFWTHRDEAERQRRKAMQVGDHLWLTVRRA